MAGPGVHSSQQFMQQQQQIAQQHPMQGMQQQQQQQQQAGRMVMVPSGMQVSSAGIQGGGVQQFVQGQAPRGGGWQAQGMSGIPGMQGMQGMPGMQGQGVPGQGVPGQGVPGQPMPQQNSAQGHVGNGMIGANLAGNPHQGHPPNGNPGGHPNPHPNPNMNPNQHVNQNSHIHPSPHPHPPPNHAHHPTHQIQQPSPHGQPVRPTITIPGSASHDPGHGSGSEMDQRGVTPNGPPAQQQVQTPVFRTPQPPGLLPPSWNKPPPTTSNNQPGTPHSAVVRTPGSAGGPQSGQPGKIAFLPPPAITSQHQVQLHPHAQQQQQQQHPPQAHVMASPAAGVTGYAVQGTPAQPIDIDRAEREGSTAVPGPPSANAAPAGVPSTPVYRVPSASVAGTPHATPSGASLALLNVQGIAPARLGPDPTAQTVYLPNGQGMVIMRQTPPSPQRHHPAANVQQMQEWRRGVMMPGIEAGQAQWGEVPDVGRCLLPGQVTSRLAEFAWAVRETSVVSRMSV